jgi:hypothetical protein
MLPYRQRAHVVALDAWLDDEVSPQYQAQPLAQDWGRTAKVIEELGEAIGELILHTGQNPRKGSDETARDRMLEELADVVWTGTLCIQHFTKDVDRTDSILAARLERLYDRVFR